MKKQFTVKHKVYDELGLIGVNTHVSNEQDPLLASKEARSTIAGQYATSLLSISYRYIRD